MATLAPHHVIVSSLISIPPHAFKQSPSTPLTCHFPLSSSSLVQIHFSDKFNQPVDQFHLSLQQLYFGKSFNQSVDHLPPPLTVLKIDSYLFEQPLDHLPSSLLTLVVDASYFNMPVDHLPSSLTFRIIHSPF